MKSKYFLIFSILLIFVFVSSIASASQYTKIGNGTAPAINGSKVVWANNGNIQIYDLITKKDTQVESSAASFPAISGDKVIWNDKNSGAPVLTIYDLNTGEKERITTNVENTSVPAIYGSRIVWSFNSTVYMYDISKSSQERIADGNDPDIYQTLIVYDSDSAGDTPQIYLYDILTKKAIDISEYGDNFFPHIYGNKVIWSDFYTRLGNIRMYAIATRQQTEVTTGDDMTGYDTGGPTDISDSRIIYLKHNDLGNMDLGDVYVYNITTGKNRQLTTGNTAQTPTISGNIAVWSDSGNIYMASLDGISI